MTEGRDERELLAELELYTPKLLPGGRGLVRFSRVWEKRANKFGNEVLEAAELGQHELIERLDESDEFSNIFQQGVTFCTDHGDSKFTDFIVKLVVGALRDDAKVSETSFLMSKMEGFHPLHVRVLVALPANNSWSDPSWRIAQSCIACEAVTLSVLGELTALKFVLEDREEEEFQLSVLGQALVDLVDEIDRGSAE